MIDNQELEKRKTIAIRGDKFELNIATLTVDNLFKIEASKQILSRNEYYRMATTWFAASSNAANLIDMISIFRVLNPEIEKCLPTDSFEELALIDSQEMLVVYVKEVAPWYNGWLKLFNQPFEEKEDEKKKDVSKVGDEK